MPAGARADLSFGCTVSISGSCRRAVLPVPPRPGLLGTAATGLGSRLAGGLRSAGTRLLSSSRAWLRPGEPSVLGLTTTVWTERTALRPLGRASPGSDGSRVTELLTRRSTCPPTTTVVLTVRVTRRSSRPTPGWGLGSRGPGKGTENSVLAVASRLGGSVLGSRGPPSPWSTASFSLPSSLFSLPGNVYFLEKIGPWLWKLLEPASPWGPW